MAEDLPGPGTVFLQVNWSFRAPVRPGDTITGRAEVLEVRSDKPISKLKTSVIRDDGTLVLEGDAVCYTIPIAEEVKPPAPLTAATKLANDADRLGRADLGSTLQAKWDLWHAVKARGRRPKVRPLRKERVGSAEN